MRAMNAGDVINKQTLEQRRDALIIANRVKGEEEDGFVPEPLEEAECTRGVCALP